MSFWEPSSPSTMRQLMDNLFEAINQGRLDLVKTLLTEDPDLINKVASIDEKELTPIELALSRGFKDIAREIIKSPAFDINKSDHNPLLLAIRLGETEIAGELLEAGANPNYFQKNTSSPLLLALEGGFFKLADNLLKKGAEIDARDEKGWTALIHAAYKGLTQVVDFLLSNKAAVNVCNNDGWSAIVGAFALGHEEIVAKLINSGALFSEKYAQAALLNSYLSGNIELTKKIIKEVSNPNIKVNNKLPLVCYCAKRGDYEVVKLLIESGANPNSLDLTGFPLLSILCEAGNLELIKLVIDQGASVNFGIENKQPIFVAIKNNCVDVVEYLVEHGANVSARDDRDDTVLMYAVRNDRLSIAEFLVKKGANPYTTNGFDKDAYSCVSSKSRFSRDNWLNCFNQFQNNIS